MMGEATLALAEGGGRGGREGLRDGPPLDGGGAVLVGGAFSTELEGGGCMSLNALSISCGQRARLPDVIQRWIQTEALVPSI